MSIVMSAVPAWPFGLEILLVFVWFGLCVIWAIRVLVAFGIAADHRHRLLAEPGAVRKILTTPAILLTVLTPVIAQLPRMTTFLVFAPAFESVAAGALRGDADACRAQWIGLFRIERVEVVGGIVRFEWGGGFMCREGLAYSKKPLPTRMGEDCYDHFLGDWYTWLQSW